MVRLDILRQRRAWNLAMKRLTKSERKKIRDVYYEPYVGSIGLSGITAASAVSGMPASIPFLTGGTLLCGSGLNLITERRSIKSPLVKKFLHLYHHELSKLRSHHNLRKVS